MTVYPSAIDDDQTIIRIDDNLSELGDQSINQLREAVFAIEEYLGINPQGSKNSVEDRISVSLNPDGSIRAQALTSIGLVTLPITNNQVAWNAGIDESKLNLTFTTADLQTKISTLTVNLNNLSVLTQRNYADIRLHTSGATYFSDGLTLSRHVASHIDINATPSDPRDPSVYWPGLLDQYGNTLLIPSNTVLGALWKINYDFRAHQTTVSSAHPATAISVDASGFTELSTEITNVQEALSYIDDIETKSAGFDRATLNTNGIVRATRNQSITLPDGYSFPVVPVTPVQTYIGELNQQHPNDSTINGDDVIRFFPTNTNFEFDTAFTNVVPGDIIRVNYASGVTGVFEISSIRFLPGLEWVVRINGTNLRNIDGYSGYYGSARIDRPQFDTNTHGVLACAAANPNVSPSLGCGNFPSSVIIGSQRGSTAVGVAFDPNQIDQNHYALYLRLYPSGDVTTYVDLPGIDVSGNLGSTPGKYNLDIITEETNKAFRFAGYNYRFIAFNSKGNFGLMLADAFNNASFSIVSGDISGTTIIPGSFSKNVIGDDRADGYDALGLGYTKASLASPVGTFTSSAAAAGFSTIVISPIKQRNSLINGVRRDFLPTDDSISGDGYVSGDGYYIATITSKTAYPADNTLVVQYTVNNNLLDAGLMAGKTIVIQPIGTPTTNVSSYGRFIVGDVSYVGSSTNIVVINGIHGTGDPLTDSVAALGTQVKLYLTNDSVIFNDANLAGTSGTYHRYHEIMANQFAKTFSVERARMEKQSASSVYLDTTVDGWRIRKVSQKLSGIRVDSTFRRFVRLVVLNYNAVNGEYDGYLAEPVGVSGVINFGPIVRGKKNHPNRYYDHSYTNYIDIEFRELNTTPGSTTIPVLPRIADIEIFPGLSLDDENFVIAGVSHDDRTITAITDLREFGTISERNFSDSALRYIELGEKYLHANGVIRGFESANNLGSSLGFLQYSGGCALVNGRFVSVDSGKVKLPNVVGIHEAFVCVNENAELVCVLKDGGQKFDTVSGYWAESLTFKEIVDKRKDLCVISYVQFTVYTGTPNTTTIVKISDAKRYVDNESINDFTFANDDGYSASFRSLRAVEVWSDEYKIPKVKIKYMKLTTAEIFATQAGNPIIFEGGAIDVIGANTGLTISCDNVSIKNCQIGYYPTYTAVVGEIMSCDVGNACILLSAANLIGTNLEGNTFYSSNAKRPPFIGFYSSYAVIDDLIIHRNTFIDSTAVANVAIGLVATDLTDVSRPSVINCIISENIAVNVQTLMISSRATPSGNIYSAASCVEVSNFVVRDNKFGAIGLLVDGRMIIRGNDAGVIATGVSVTLNTNTLPGFYGGSFLNSCLFTFANANIFPSLNITENTCQSIKVDSVGFEVNITNNKIGCISPLLQSVFFANYTVLYGVVINENAGATNYNANISGNTISNLGTSYNSAISCYAKATINNNIIDNCISNLGRGIDNIGYSCLITGNTINRGAVNISSYINATGESSVQNNYFDKFWVSGAVDAAGVGMGFNSILNAQTNLVARNNYNQTTDAIVNQECATILLGSSKLFTLAADTEISKLVWITSQPTQNEIVIGSGAGAFTKCSVIYPFVNILPKNISLLSLSIDWSRGINASDATSQIVFSLETDSSSAILATIDISLVTPTSGTVTYYNPVLATGVRPTVHNYRLFATIYCQNTGANTTITFSNLNIRWCY